MRQGVRFRSCARPTGAGPRPFSTPALNSGDAPKVLAVGDIHIENYGSWRDAEGRVVWGVNDFDEAAKCPTRSTWCGSPPARCWPTCADGRGRGLPPHSCRLPQGCRQAAAVRARPPASMAAREGGRAGGGPDKILDQVRSGEEQVETPDRTALSQGVAGGIAARVRSDVLAAHRRDGFAWTPAVGRLCGLAGRAGGARSKSGAVLGLGASPWGFAAVALRGSRARPPSPPNLVPDRARHRGAAASPNDRKIELPSGRRTRSTRVLQSARPS